MALAAGVVPGSALGIGAPWDRERRRLPRKDDLRASPRRGDERQRRANVLGALAHAGHAEPGSAPVAGHAPPVVSHRQSEPDAADGAGVNDDAAGARMAGGVGQGLLGDADDLAL